MNEQERLNALTAPLLTWYDIHKRVLPWRGIRDPYRIWVSEIMLQQTRVQAVLEYYARFMAELLARTAARKALAQRARAFALQNFRKRLREQIPQRDVALVIETARHRRAVGEHAELVAQAVAELCAALLCVKVGPVEFFCALKVQIVPQAEAAAARLGPLARTFFVKKGFDHAVARLRAALIPQPQRNDDALRGGCGMRAARRRATA